jgi:hypothetical protein
VRTRRRRRKRRRRRLCDNDKDKINKALLMSEKVLWNCIKNTSLSTTET